MHFLDLPVEVLSMILEESRPDGCVRFIRVTDLGVASISPF